MNNEYIRKQDAIDDLHTQLMYRMGSDDMKRRLDDWVTTLPSADVAPVRHGHWTLVGWHKGMKVVECSCCKKRAIGSTDFCPKCGAKMDGKGER